MMMIMNHNIKISLICFICIENILLNDFRAFSYELISDNLIIPKIWLTVSAQTRNIEVTWDNGRLKYGDLILITNDEPLVFVHAAESETEKLSSPSSYEEASGDYGQTTTTTTTDDSLIIPIQKSYENNDPYYKNKWLCNNDSISVLTVIIPREINDWITTTIPFDYELSRQITIDTNCYGYWASYIDHNGNILAKNCIRTHSKWMNEMKSAIADFRIRDLFIPGTHDSGSYRINFDPLKKDTIVTKYSLTQDDDIFGQLIHGARYLDLRIGFYRASDEKFFVNHGISRQRPLQDVIDQIIDFVKKTNEIVIVDIQEFPVGFGRDLNIHRFLVHFLKSKLENYLVDPSLGWQVTLRDIWKRKKNIILSYDYAEVVSEFPKILFYSVQQRWGDVRSLERLEEFLKRINEIDRLRLSSRPVADMAELTPTAWGVITDRYGGLRRLADKVNHRVSKLYMNELGQNANIVAVDFMRGTTIVEAAINWNSKKVVAR